MNTKHSPPPWNVMDDPPFMPERMRGCIITANDPRVEDDSWDVCYLDRGLPFEPGEAIVAGGAYSDQVEALYRDIHDANKRLIAAAPEMYEFIRSLENDDGRVPAAIWELRNAVLAKIEGGAA